MSQASAGWDAEILLAVASWRRAGLTMVMRGLTTIGSGAVEIPFGLAFAAWLGWLGRRRESWFYAGTVLSGWALNGLLKAAFARPRPDLIPRLSGAGWYSFPSGHAMLAPLVFVLAAALTPPSAWGGRLRPVMLTSAVLLTLAIAGSRVYLGVHYPTDVLGGLCAGAGWALLGWGVVGPRSGGRVGAG